MKKNKTFLKSMPDCIVAAGGLSSRMKTWKLSLPWGRITIIEKVVGEALEAGCRVVVAGGYRFSELRGLFGNHPESNRLHFHYSPRWQLGMDETVRSALDCITSDCFFVTPADMPLISNEDYRKLAFLHEGTKASVLRPSFFGKPGHPVLLDPGAAKTLRHSAPGTPVRSILSGLETVMESWDHDGVIKDIDTVESYNELRQELMESTED